MPDRARQLAHASDVPPERIVKIARFREDLRTFLRHSERACRDWDLTPQRYLLLLAIKGAPDGTERMSFTDLAKHLQVSPNTVTELCARAEGAGLITRERSETDQRVVYLRVTEEGERRLVGAIRASDGDRAELLAAFEALTATFHLAARRPRAPR